MIRYELIRSMTTEYSDAYDSYGIKVIENGRCIRVIRDITDRRDRLSALVDNMNELALDPIHLDQVIEDFLYGM